METETLTGCPFCGHEPTIRPTAFRTFQGCCDCGGSAPPGRTRKEAAANWNRRRASRWVSVETVNHDALLLAAADALAAWLHRDDVDKQQKPLIGHCRRVAATLREQGWPVEVQAAGFLHDAIEDAPAGEKGARYEMMETALCDRVADLVAAVSRKANEPYREYIETLAHPFNDEARAIKLADLRDNLDESRGPIKESLRKRYLRAVARLEGANG